MAMLQAGAACVEIPVPADLPLIGFAARGSATALGQHDPITSRALVLRNDEASLVLCAVDLLGIGAEMRADVVERVLVAAAIPGDHIAVSATHTESAPGCIFRGPIEAFFGTFRADFYEDVVDSIARSILDAHDRMRPARLGIGSIRIEGLTQNSRHPELGPCDDEVGILRVVDLKGDAIALVSVCCAHNTALDHHNMRVSADVGGVFCRTVEGRLGLGSVGIFFAGEQGDLGFRRSRFPGLAGFELAEAIGADLSERVLDAQSRIALDARPRLAVAVERFEPPPPTVPISTEPILMQAMILGDSGWLIVPGEPIAEIGLGFKRHMRESGLGHAHVIALANDQLGYVLTPEEFRAGGYQPTVSFFGETFGDVFSAAAIRTFERAHHQRPTRRVPSGPSVG
ncbi:MAG: neutral/alkaline non-lysosomal ceramidase N-terminal domain-containing protein [Myxococcota bacterium]